MIFCSYVIPTIGRDTLDIAVRSVLEQEFSAADFEVIVVNDSGQPLPVWPWMQSRRVRVIHTNRSERSCARNAGAAAARGEYVAFLDDDDWILPGALQSFWDLSRRFPQAVWLYGGIRVVDQDGETLGEINTGFSGNVFPQFTGGTWAPLQTSMALTRAFFEVGGFDPGISGTEDLDLTARLSYHGPFASTQDVVGVLFRGQTWNTSTNYLRAPGDIKFSRDRLLAKPGAFTRLWRGVPSDFWRGRLIRVYLSTIGMNLKQRRIFRVLSRAWYTAGGLLVCLPHMFSNEFWAGLRAEHAPGSLHFVMLEYERKMREQAASAAQ